MPQPLSIESLRRDFPAATDGIYLNVAARSILSNTALAAVNALITSHQGGATKKESWDHIGESCRAHFARLIGASADEIAYTKNVSEGLNIVAQAFPWQEGDNVVLCPALEHPNNIYAWLNLRRRGVEVRTVPAQNNAIDTAAMIRAIDHRTRLLTAATVSFTPGYRTDVATLGRACRERGVFFLVDAVQSSGVLKIDVAESCIDGLATATSKGLLGLYGLGFLYVRRDWIDRLVPAYLARFSVDQGAAHESEMGSLDYRLLADARRFEAGHYPWPALAAADASLGQLLAVGPERIEAHATALAARLGDGLAALGLPVCRPPAGVAPTQIVTVGHMGVGSAYSTADARLNAVGAYLEAQGVRFSVRRGLLRFATHAYNDARDIERVLELARAALARAAAE